VAIFYSTIVPSPALERGYKYLLDAIDFYTRKGRFQDAAFVRSVLAQMWRDYEQLSVAGAAEADRLIRERIRQTQVRPDASGRLIGSIQSRPLRAALPGGGVGIADLDILEKGTVNPNAPKAGSYWRAQNYGTTAHVGRIVPGYFQPGNARPSAAEFRVHPYFQQSGPPARRGTPAMVIRRPLQARHFMEDGTRAAVNWHRARSNEIDNRAVARLRAL
jgi:hypothetical protein